MYAIGYHCKECGADGTIEEFERKEIKITEIALEQQVFEDIPL